MSNFRQFNLKFNNKDFQTVRDMLSEGFLFLIHELADELICQLLYFN